VSLEADFAVRTEQITDGTTVVALGGELDLYRLPALADALQSAASARKVVVDLREVTFLDSTTLALLIKEQRHRRDNGRELLVVVGPQTPLTAFAVTGTDRILTIQPADADGDTGSPTTPLRNRLVQAELETTAGRPSAMQSVNAEIAVVAAEFDRRVDEPLRWGFACECGEADCAEWVDLDLAAYSAVRADGTGAILAEGHSLSRVERARRHGAQLRDNAAALRAQARHQAARARRAGRVRRDYHYELRDGERTLATGRLSSTEPIEVGDTVDLAGSAATVERIEPVTGDHELLLVARLQHTPPHA
jgi:anti-sigma B factor antagonist